MVCLLLALPTLATPIEPGKGADNHPGGGATTADLFEFSPFTPISLGPLEGFSDPLGAGVDPLFGVFSGSVHNLDLLGNLTITREFEPANLKPATSAALHTSDIINMLLYSYLAPKSRQLLAIQLNLDDATLMEIGGTPMTTETAPLSLVGFGSVSDPGVKPANVHWTHCPEAQKRAVLFKAQGKRLGKLCTRPPCDCFML